ncbi:glycosyltransferase family 39 protein [Chitinophaga sp. B61]|uniref:Glycosyltransferase family 39 protein n=2 Tax=Chitinophaga rhizophila TaxID=2866212 RepID=A0ABS7GE55_9BACT|nr:glycosyltransferase family 39 protein [Chitinophaga rhizophila]
MVGLLVFVHMTGLPVTIMEPDGALYAGIAKHMVQHHDYLNLVADGRDWLDKPHFPFWMAALSYLLFGFTSFAYKLPAFLFLMMGAVYTYRFAKALNVYNERVARWSVCIFLSAEHLVISSTDVRAEPYLTGLIIASVYHLYKRQLLPGALFAACAVMTKGPFALVPIGFAIIGDHVFTGRWKQLFHWHWLVTALLILVFISPELYALYQQFDAHPEKVVFGQTGVSGIRFFFWDSQFGRFMNSGPIKGHGDPSFFLHTVLWAFLPWSIFLYVAIVQFFRRRGKSAVEYYCISAALSTFLLFSLSKFQLPHYLNIIFPFFAILTAKYIVDDVPERAFRITQHILMGIMGIAIVGLWALYRPEIHLWAVILIMIGIAAFIWLPLQGTARVFFRTCMAGVILNIFLNGLFYPDVLRYQSGSTAAFYANKELKGAAVGFYGVNSYAMEYYLDAPLLRYDTVPAGPSIVFTSAEHRDSLVAGGRRIKELKTFSQFPVTRLDLKFVNFFSRESSLDKRFLILVDPF